MSGTLLTADGKTYPLRFDQEDVGNFRISRFKRAVMVASTEKQVSLTNAQVILEVRSQENSVVFRNIYAVEHQSSPAVGQGSPDRALGGGCRG